jgi:hypothetical protein
MVPAPSENLKNTTRVRGDECDRRDDQGWLWSPAAAVAQIQWALNDERPLPGGLPETSEDRSWPAAEARSTSAKYPSSTKLTVAIHLNRVGQFAPSELVIPSLGAAAVWVFGAIRPDRSRWAV